MQRHENMDSMPNFGEASKSSSSSDTANTIVNRIRERLLQLEVEQDALQVAQAELAQVQEQLKRALHVRNSQRRTYLNAIQSRNIVETELWNVRDRTDTLREEIARNKNETALAAQELDNVNKDWEDAMKDLYSKHKVRMLLFQRFVENHVHKKEERKNRRQNRIHSMTRQAELLLQQEHEMEQETRVLESKLRVPEFVPECNTMAATAEQIRAALQERSVIRQNLQAAQSAFKMADNDMAKLEQECFSMIDRST